MNNLRAMLVVSWFVFLDQISKFIFSSITKLDTQYSDGNLINLLPVYNKYSMGIFAYFYDSDEYLAIVNTTLFLISSFMVAFIILKLWKRVNEHVNSGVNELKLMGYGLLSIISGTIGNSIDAIRGNGVYDFLSIMNGETQIIFNIADCLLWVGYLIIIVSMVQVLVSKATQKQIA